MRTQHDESRQECDNNGVDDSVLHHHPPPLFLLLNREQRWTNLFRWPQPNCAQVTSQVNE